MNLKKQESGYKYQDKKKEYRLFQSPVVDNKLFVEDLEAVLGRGKYSDKTLGWIKDNESWYYLWLKNNNLIQLWGLIKDPKPKKKVVGISLKDGIYYYRNTVIATDDEDNLVYDDKGRLYIGILYDNSLPYQHSESPFL